MSQEPQCSLKPLGSRAEPRAVFCTLCVCRASITAAPCKLLLGPLENKGCHPAVPSMCQGGALPDAQGKAKLLPDFPPVLPSAPSRLRAAGWHMEAPGWIRSLNHHHQCSFLLLHCPPVWVAAQALPRVPPGWGGGASSQRVSGEHTGTPPFPRA